MNPSTFPYSNDRIATVKHNTTGDNTDVVYTFNYNTLGQQTSVQVGSQTLSTNHYKDDRTRALDHVVFGNGGGIYYQYDEFDRPISSHFDSETSPRYEYIYGPNGTVGKVKDNNLGRTVETEYDLADRPIVVTHRDSSGNLLYRTSLDYDKCHIQGCGHTDAIHCEYTAKGNLTQFKEEIDGRTHLTAYQYDKDNRTTQVQFGDTTHKVSYTYDALGRVTTRSAVNGSNTASSTYTYAAGYDGGTTPLVTKITQPQISFEYVYDNAGNITSEKRGSKYTTYQYDALWSLICIALWRGGVEGRTKVPACGGSVPK